MTVGLFFVGVAALVGMVCQRATGFGYALVAVPVFAIVLGPFYGVLLSNTLSIPVNAFVLVGTWRGLQLKPLLLLVPAGLCGAVVGVVAATTLPSSYLLMLAGLVILALVVSLWLAGRSVEVVIAEGMRRTRGLLRTGLTSGVLQAATGTGGPPMAIYAARAGWPFAAFIPTMQTFNLFVGAVTVALKRPLPMPWPAIAGLLACLVVGAWIGALVARRTRTERLRSFSILLAAAGGLAAFVKGVLAL